jgi:hypothetical protein
VEVAIGIDPAKDSLAVAAVDALGRCLALPISNDSKGHRAQGKSDLVDSVAIARIAASGEELPSARMLELLTDIRALVGFRDQLVRARTQ